MSTLTIELDSQTEARLLERSRAEGRNREELAARLLAGAVTAQHTLSAQEVDLLRRAHEELPDADWKRYRQLSRKRRAETITPDEYAELLALGDRVETHHVGRLEAVVELARLWNRDFEETRRLLGVGPRRG